MSNRIIFLDIDGPMIPSYMYFVNVNASFSRLFSPGCTHAINYIAERTGALIAFNSFHNFQHTYDGTKDTGETIREAAIRNGIKEQYIAPEWRTLYKKLYPTRYEAISAYIRDNPQFNHWLAIDDENFSDEARARGGKQILIDFDYGISGPEVNEAIKWFNPKASGLLIL